MRPWGQGRGALEEGTACRLEEIGRALVKQKQELELGRAREAGGEGCTRGLPGEDRGVTEEGRFKGPGAWYSRHVWEARRWRSRRRRPEERSLS